MRRYLSAVFLLVFLPAAAAIAHPHMFIDMKLTPVFSEERFEGVQVNWLFDMVFTGSVLMDNGIGWTESFSDDEIGIIRDTSFVNLINYNYFTFFNIDRRITPARSFSSFTAFMSENRLGYDFFIPYEGNNPGADTIRIAVYDETFFCDIAFTENAPVKIKAPAGADIDWVLSERRDAPIFYDNTAQMVSREGAEYSGQAFPVELVLTVK